MERSEWLRRMRRLAEGLYDQISPKYWVTYGLYANQSHQTYLQKFLDLLRQSAGPGERILSAGCGAGRYDGFLLDAGYSVLGIDLSAGMLARAREHFPLDQFPQLRYEKLGLQELEGSQVYRAAFAGVICMDAMEHICPEDYPGILRGFQQALRPGGLLYFTVDTAEQQDLQSAFERARARGLPVLFGEVADQVEQLADEMQASGQLVPDDAIDRTVYHYYPPLPQVRDWLTQAGLSIVTEGAGQESDNDISYHHIIARKGEG